ncbi:hypothetical protein Q1695_001289 [Nippostrongylus brasiliensis]|nr:hypothetical protein Q1695_001289 [Nippostrongylus brasiliensis]
MLKERRGLNRSGQWRVVLFTTACLTLIILHFLLYADNFTDDNSCTCKDAHGNIFDFCYKSRSNTSARGMSFSCDHLIELERLGLLNNLPPYNITNGLEPVFITAFSQSHFMEGKRLVASIRKFHKTVKIVVYDIGLTLKGAARVKRWCHVEYRRFSFENYPPYFKQLYTFRWKPIVIAEALRDFGVIWYMDTSVILEKGDLGHVHALVECRANQHNSFPILSVKERDTRESHWQKVYAWDTVQWTANVNECKKSTYLLHGFTGHGIYTATDPNIYSYFPVSTEELKKPKAKMYEAGLVFAARTSETVERILKWSVLCALEESCMGTNIIPNICDFNNNDLYGSFAACHRYDQSVINVLLADEYYYDRRYYTSEITDFFRIQRFLTRDVKNRELKCD